MVKNLGIKEEKLYPSVRNKEFTGRYKKYMTRRFNIMADYNEIELIKYKKEVLDHLDRGKKGLKRNKIRFMKRRLKGLRGSFFGLDLTKLLSSKLEKMKLN